jgi:dipeptidyl aminopeptidase/acylaminoacyl peptidase
MLAETIEVRDLGPVHMAFAAAPVVSPDGRGVIYLQQMPGTTPFPVMSRDMNTFVERRLFSVPAGSALWTVNHRSGTLLISVPNPGGPAGGRHIREYALDSTIVHDFIGRDGRDDTHAAISPDGASLMFVRSVPNVESLMVADALNDRSPPQPVSKFLFNEAIRSLHWLDNQRALVSTLNGTDLSNQVRYRSSQVDYLSSLGLGPWATAGPAGRPIASLATGPDNWRLSELDGASMTQITTSQTFKTLLNWSADGHVLVYQTSDGLTMSNLEVALLPPLK